MLKPLPLSLYIHTPWCLRKCPYCDFNSHEAISPLPEDGYINALIADLESSLPSIWGRSVSSIFIGGGTPSLFSPQSIEKILTAVNARLPFYPGIEITMEANPGTFEQQRFKDFRLAGINRLSIGIQSFQQEKLLALGRVHNANEAMQAVEIAHRAGFNNLNLDLMHGLPGQSLDDAIFDLNTALQFEPPHLSWYQLTLEPNTVFAKFPPSLPEENLLYDIQEAGEALLADYDHYEISAYAKPNHQCTHNLNYWLFGDYLGIGAGAHSKITDLSTQQITRSVRAKQPKHYMDPEKPCQVQAHHVERKDRLLEFMMNALRLSQPIELELLHERTGLMQADYLHLLEQAQLREFIEYNEHVMHVTPLGRQFLNDCLAVFS